MTIKIYINNKPLESYSEKELEEIKRELTYRAFAAAGYVQKGGANSGKTNCCGI